ncbi:hypothetical protein [Actinoplanes sp. GCM10030250]|uniref:hypothetical protein n=1 Tax=Actinoplanes sp. GCM10030250 TaxID=3273376 RepID=UPI00361A7CFF
MSSTPPAPRPKRDMVALISTVAAVVGVVVAVLAWRWPEAPPSEQDQKAVTAPTTTGGTATSPAPAGGTPAPSAAAYLDALPVKGGSLAEVPRKIRDQADYRSHPIAVACPSNQIGDKATEVTWQLDRNYVEFHADVRPYYPAAGEQRAVTYVTALKGVRQRDTTDKFEEMGSQKTARPGGSAPISADLDGGDTLTLKIECQYPGGFVILTDARLVPAG